MKIYKQSTIFKLSTTYFVAILAAMLFCIATIPFNGEPPASPKDAVIMIGFITLTCLVLAVALYFGLYSLRYIALDDTQIVFSGALPPTRTRVYYYSEIKKCVIANDYSLLQPLCFKVHTTDGKMRKEPIGMVRSGDLRDIADELMAHGVVVESSIKL